MFFFDLFIIFFQQNNKVGSETLYLIENSVILNKYDWQ